jgi:hypothetical protein
MRYSQNAANLSVDELGDLYLAYKGNKSDSLVVDFCKHFGFVSPKRERARFFVGFWP